MASIAKVSAGAKTALSGFLIGAALAILFPLVATGALKGSGLSFGWPNEGWHKPRYVTPKEHGVTRKAQVKEVLGRNEARLLKDLFAQARRGQQGGSLKGTDHDAWPLPGHVRIAMQQGEGQAW